MPFVVCENVQRETGLKDWFVMEVAPWEMASVTHLDLEDEAQAEVARRRAEQHEAVQKLAAEAAYILGRPGRTVTLEPQIKVVEAPKAKKGRKA